MKLSNLLSFISVCIAGIALFFMLKKKPFVGVDLIVNPDKMSEGEIKLTSDTVFNSMANFGTDEQTLFAALQPLSASDLMRVFNAFGSKRYFNGTWSSLLGYDQNLFGWFRSELSNAQIKQMQIIWDKSGLTI